jgi:hypothetical protein
LRRRHGASLVPSLDGDIHLVLCRFGRAGLAYLETDPAEADATTTVQNLLLGRYGEPVRVIALNVDEGWSQDVNGMQGARDCTARRLRAQRANTGVRRGPQSAGGPADLAAVVK